MPRPEVKEITFSIDGREVRSEENLMLVDAAKHGDVEIPIFCYEPKLGAPVGACRQCLVEIEGIPKLQTACSTPVKDGMVVHTATDRVREAQASVLEFLLINHPLDCPVCDKGGECPLQDMSFGFGGGKSRFIEPKRHFKKPLELSPLIAIDRERCILCYRCVRFSQELSEDYQLVLHERGAATYVGTFDGHPYSAPFSGNIIELCPVGALTSRPYRFRARPWDIENAGSVCTLCPGQCNVSFTVRDDRVLRVMARDNHEVDDGWLCDKGRFAYQAIHVDERITAPMVRDGGVLRETTWERALEEAESALKKNAGAIAGVAGGSTTNEEAFLFQRLLRDVHGSPHVASGPAIDRASRLALSAPGLQATVADLEFAHTVLVLGTEPVDDMAALDLRIRKGVRRNRVKLAVATPRPSTLDPNATMSVRYAPGGEGAFVAALSAAFYGGAVDEPARASGADAGAIKDLAKLLRTSGGDEAGDVVIVYGESLLRSEGAVAPLLKLAGALSLSGRPGAGLLEVPSAVNGRGIREAGVLPDAGPGYAALAGDAGLGVDAIARATADGHVNVVHLLHTDPVRDEPHAWLWDRALDKATHVIAHAGFLTAGLREHATVIFPAESQAEKEGTIVHPDGRLQRLRPAIGRQGQTRATWQVLSTLLKRAGAGSTPFTVYSVTQELLQTVPFYAGLTVDTIGPKGTRWWEDEARADAWPAAQGALPAPADTVSAKDPKPGYAPVATPNGALRLGTYRSIWAAPEVEASPALKFLIPKQLVELAPVDAERLGLDHGDRVVVSDRAGAVEGRVHLRHAAPTGSAFLQAGIDDFPANRLEGPLVTVAKWQPPVLVTTLPDAEDDALAEEVAHSDRTGLPPDGSLAGADEATPRAHTDEDA